MQGMIHGRRVGSEWKGWPAFSLCAAKGICPCEEGQYGGYTAQAAWMITLKGVQCGCQEPTGSDWCLVLPRARPPARSRGRSSTFSVGCPLSDCTLQQMSVMRWCNLEMKWTHPQTTRGRNDPSSPTSHRVLWYLLQRTQLFTGPSVPPK